MAKRPLGRKIAISFITGIIITGFIYYISDISAVAASSESKTLTPYFTYSEKDLQSLDSLESNKIITDAEIDKWINTAFNLVKKNHKEVDITRLYAYLFTAQQDAAALSYQSKKRLAGNLTAVSTKTLCLLLPDECVNIPAGEESDAFSLKIADMVISKVKERLAEEKKVLDATPLLQAPPEWPQGKYYGSNFGHMKTWLLNSGDQFRLENPKAYGPQEIKNQKEELERILSSITKDQLEIAEKWSAGQGSISLSGKWIELADAYMTEHQVPLERAMVIRAVLAMGVADATTAYFDSKYTYWKLRPSMQFPDLKSSIKAATSPSYPSGHATIAMAAAIIMDHYFPENQAIWDGTAQEIGHSRLWGGVHFPVDDHDGIELGRKIGDWVVKKIISQKNQKTD